MSGKSSLEAAPVSREEAFNGEVGELGDEFFRDAWVTDGGKVIRRGRGRPPFGKLAKVQQSLRLSPEVLEHFRATGPGWQARIDDVLRDHVQRSKAA